MYFTQRSPSLAADFGRRGGGGGGGGGRCRRFVQFDAPTSTGTLSSTSVELRPPVSTSSAAVTPVGEEEEGQEERAALQQSAPPKKPPRYEREKTF